MTSSFNDDVPYDIGEALATGFALNLAGSLDITEDINDVSGFNDDLFLASNDTDRFVGISLLRPTYYIRTGFDINSKVSIFFGNDSGNNGIDGLGNDDAWTLDAFSVGLLGTGAAELASEATTTYALKAGNATVNVANIDATDDDQTQSYTLDFELNVSDQGLLTITNTTGQDSINAWTGNSISGLVNDDITKAQGAFWTNDTSANIFDLGVAHRPVVSGASTEAPGANDVDRLLAVLTKADVAAYYNDDTNTAASYFDNKTVFTDWTISFDAQGNDTESNLSAYARNRFTGEAGSTPNDAPFKVNDQIVASTPAQYVLNVTDNNGTTHNLVTADVYGVVYQTA